MPLSFRSTVLALFFALPLPALAQESIVGTWTGTVVQGEQTFATTYTFVSPRGGVSRYPGVPCGGILAGGPKGDGFEYSETITWGTLEEKPEGCINGTMRMAVDGDTMTLAWNGSHNGQALTAAGELRRVGVKAKKK